MGEVLKIRSAAGSNLSAPPGYLGLSERQIEVDWNAVAQHGPCVMVKARSPAWKSGLRDGDNVAAINDVSYADFHVAMPAAGTNFTVVAYRKGFGIIRTFGVLEPAPVPRPRAAWKNTPGVLPGRRVERKERPRFVQHDAARNPNLADRDVRMLNLLFELDCPKGVFPKHGTLASQAACGISSVKESLSRLQHFGYLRIISGKRRRTSNTYEATWPAGRAPAQIDGNGDTQAASDSKSDILSERIMNICGIKPGERRSRDANRIVEGWLARPYDARIIEDTVRNVMKNQRPSFNSLSYFGPAIAKAHGEKPR